MIRNKWLEQTDDKLLEDCNFEAFKAGGPGGQKQNKTSSAVRLIHIHSKIVSESIESRYRYENTRRALKKLRLRIAIEIRESLSGNISFQKLFLSTNNRFVKIATLLDLLQNNGFQISTSAKQIGFSTGQLVRFIAKEPLLWTKINTERQKIGLKPLKK